MKFVTAEYHSDNDKFGDEELRIPGGYYEERQTSDTGERKQPTKNSPKLSKNEDLAQSEALCARFKATLSRKDVKVHFVGAW
jgi:hypothetical protein